MSESDTVSATAQVAAPIDRVWRAITDPEELIKWYAPGCRWEIPDLRAGGTVRFYNSETDIQRATIERCAPPGELVLRWTPDPTLPGTTLLNSYVLREHGKGTSVTVSQSGYASVPADQRISWFESDAKSFPAIARALAAHLK